MACSRVVGDLTGTGPRATNTEKASEEREANDHRQRFDAPKEGSDRRQAGSWASGGSPAVASWLSPMNTPAASATARHNRQGCRRRSR